MRFHFFSIYSVHAVSTVTLYVYHTTNIVGLGIGCNFQIDYQYIITDSLID